MSPLLDSVIFNSSDSAHSALVRTLEGLALPCQDHFHLNCHLSRFTDSLGQLLVTVASLVCLFG